MEFLKPCRSLDWFNKLNKKLTKPLSVNISLRILVRSADLTAISCSHQFSTQKPKNYIIKNEHFHLTLVIILVTVLT